ncbi:hypothetical protein [Niallia taxi]|uniref:hypothetical protein n=1 Tax=Niallia taxi TaxID=2499688 RepID=UPI0015F47E37|nr:hypothetical protein [Niallia taxi]
MTFKVIDGSPKPMRVHKREKSELKDMADLIRYEPEVYMVNGFDKESVLAFADTLDHVSEFDVVVTDEIIKKLFAEWVRDKEFKRIHQELADLVKFAKEQKKKKSLQRKKLLRAEHLEFLRGLINEIDQIYARPRK